MALVVLLGGLALASAAWAAQAPGRVVVALGGVQPTVDGGSVDGAIALPDGDVALAGGGPLEESGFSMAELKPDGSLDQAFGQGRIVHVGLPLTAEQLLREPDGKLLVLVAGARLSKYQLPQLAVVRLDANGAIDKRYGVDGVATTSLEQGEGGRGAADAALTASGELVVTGTTGLLPPHRNAHHHWAVEELTTAGTPDPGFGTHGVATIELATGFGFEVAVLPNGEVVTTGAAQRGLTYLTRLTPEGDPDTSFAGGVPVATGLNGAGVLAAPDGTLTLAGATTLVRYTAEGRPDSSFGTVSLPSGFETQQLLPGPGSGLLVTSASAPLDGNGFTPGTTTLDVEAVPTAGTQPRATHVAALRLPFGGGYSSLLSGPFATAGPTPAEDTFSGQDVRLLQRPDGSYLVVGTVAINEPTDNQGDGSSLTAFAAAAFTSDLAPDTTFGVTPPPIRFAIRLPGQQTAADVQARAIELALDANCQGLADVTVRDGAGVIAQNTYPLFNAGAHSDPVALTSLGTRELKAHRTEAITIHAVVRDLYARTHSITTWGSLG